LPREFTGCRAARFFVAGEKVEQKRVCLLNHFRARAVPRAVSAAAPACAKMTNPRAGGQAQVAVQHDRQLQPNRPHDCGLGRCAYDRPSSPRDEAKRQCKIQAHGERLS
jgi:hypothetical protein